MHAHIMSHTGSILGLEGEQPHTSYASVISESSIPAYIRPYLPYIIRALGWGARVEWLSQSVGQRTIMQMYALITRVKAYQQAYVE